MSRDQQFRFSRMQATGIVTVVILAGAVWASVDPELLRHDGIAWALLPWITIVGSLGLAIWAWRRFDGVDPTSSRGLIGLLIGLALAAVLGVMIGQILPPEAPWVMPLFLGILATWGAILWLLRRRCDRPGVRRQPRSG